MAAGKVRCIQYNNQFAAVGTLPRNAVVPALVTLAPELLKELLGIENSVEVMNEDILIPSLHITEVAFSFIKRIINDPKHYARHDVQLKINNANNKKLGNQSTSEKKIHRNQVQAMERGYTFSAVAAYLWCRDEKDCKDKFFLSIGYNNIHTAISELLKNINFSTFMNTMFCTNWMSTQCVAYGLLMSHVDINNENCNAKLKWYKSLYMTHDINGDSRILTRIRNIMKGEGENVSDTLIMQQLRFIQFLLQHLKFLFVSNHKEQLLIYADAKAKECEKFYDLMFDSVSSDRPTINEGNIEGSIESIESVVLRSRGNFKISPLLATLKNLVIFSVPKETEDMTIILNTFNESKRKRKINEAEVDNEDDEIDPNGAENNEDDEDELDELDDEDDEDDEGDKRMDIEEMNNVR